MWEKWGRRSGIAILKPGCTLEPPGHHFKHTGARVGNQDRCPCEHSLMFLVSRDGIMSHSSCSHILFLCLSLSLSLTHTHTHIHTHTHTHTHARMRARTRALSWLFHSKAAGSTALLGSSLARQLHLGWSPTAPRNQAGAKGGSSCLHTRLIPTQFRHQRETGTHCFEYIPSLL